MLLIKKKTGFILCIGKEYEEKKKKYRKIVTGPTTPVGNWKEGTVRKQQTAVATPADA